MRQFGLFLSTAMLGLLVQAAQAGDCGCAASAGGCGSCNDCCDPCGGCCDGCGNGKRCELKIGTKKIKVTCYGCECKETCLPGPSRKGCTHCEELCGNCGACGCDCECGHKPACKVRWTDWCPSPCAKMYNVKKLVKYEAEKEVPDYKWVVVDCCAEGAAPAPAKAGGGEDKPPMPPVPTPASTTTQRRKITRPAPANARVGDTFPLTDVEIKQIEAQIQQASHVATTARTAARPVAKLAPAKAAPVKVAPAKTVRPVSAEVVATDVPWSLFGN
ncbi:MAG: hypothetical protein DCC68_15325 [Planctomycetota bacterium]|nr:MAG: hypothetical protein DCC68_15325 [Planctomycetota bacterium]